MTEEIFKLWKENITLINENLISPFKNKSSLLDDYALYHLTSGGRRIRPIICLLMCQALGGKKEDALPYALALELLHNVSLIHDDIIDGDKLRRNKPTLQQKFGLENALLTGDYMVSKAFEMITEEENFSGDKDFLALKELARAGKMTSLGEKENIGLSLKYSHSLVNADEYIKICEHKTSSFFQAAAYLGVLSVTTDDMFLQKAREYGINLGIAFQIRDDMLDIHNDMLKEQNGNNAYMKSPNFVIIKALNLFEGKRLETSNKKIFEKIVSNDADEIAKNEAIKYLTKANKRLEFLPESEYKNELKILTEWVIAREA